MADDISVTREVSGDIDSALSAAKDAAGSHRIAKVTKVEITSKQERSPGFAPKSRDDSWSVTVTGTDT